ncbi:alpha/beta-hydrolase [Dichomitus squalens]|uniref:Alpha/beta-hydrolase n=1 Tax=Dichomitus squalens TaxID=114155 RepID=A0A4Q9MZE6_9APHY|nr:alpha/beta-hydrolase [Dichomitus squalens]
MASFEKTLNIKIPSKTDGWNLDAWKYLPKTVGAEPKGLPVIVMAHGISANKSMGLGKYAEEFVGMGYGIVVFDYRRWGTSDGTPRHVVYVSEQLDDYRTVVKYVRQQPEFDPQRVILWGTSFSGGHVVNLASEETLNVSAVVSQCPYLGNTPFPHISTAFIKTMFAAISDLLKQAIGLSPRYMPAVARPGEVGLMTWADNYEGMFGIVKGDAIYPNEVNASAMLDFPLYTPSASASRVAFPTIIIAAEHDSLCPITEAKKVKDASNKVELVTLPCGHFDLYPGTTSAHDKTLEAMKKFLLDHVPPVRSS